MKRQTFYIRADLFEVRISPRAKLILAYLFRVSDRQGRSHPSVSTVAYRCGCCPNSARKALHELEGAGLVAVTPNSLPTRRGNRVHAANTYTLLSKRALFPAFYNSITSRSRPCCGLSEYGW